ncbi:hypothetical protein EUGRSUZ_L01398 [Eucalyptus grandis]|uniref:Uncharacterized protein n=1 Tax=Eucalyptus grandis TaxID=71139 RepID=A0A058ZUA0_EUCGR|nr:hypothetical protein EUGRSUZ_L01398 [Eucalyptus grandis]
MFLRKPRSIILLGMVTNLARFGLMTSKPPSNFDPVIVTSNPVAHSKSSSSALFRDEAISSRISSRQSPKMRNSSFRCRFMALIIAFLVDFDL